MKVKKGDKVLVISGKDKGKTGKIAMTFPVDRKIVVEGINVRKKHIRSKKEGQKGQIIQRSMPVNVSAVKLVCPGCEKAVRVGYKILEKGKKVRICKKCKAEVQ